MDRDPSDGGAADFTGMPCLRAMYFPFVSEQGFEAGGQADGQTVVAEGDAVRLT